MSSAARANAAGDTIADHADTHHYYSHGLAALLRRASTTAGTPRRTLVKTRPADDKMAAPTNCISSEEYAALPTSIQRKYFSSEERLAITQRSAAEKRQRQPSKQSSTTSTSSRSPALPVFPKRRRTFSKADTKAHRRSSLPSAWNFDNEIAASSNDPKWFHALPDKVKRSQFSRAEIEAIDACKHSDVERPRTSSACKTTFDTFSWAHTKPLRKQASFHSPSVSVSPSTCSNQTSQSAPQISRSHSPMTANTSLTSRSTPASPAIPALILTLTAAAPPPTKRPSLRRPFVLQPLPLPPPVLAPLPYSPPPDTTSYINTIRTLGSSQLLLDDAMQDEEETTPTQETEQARLDLALPPAWYDEKLNFDFDSDFHKPSVSTNASDQPRPLSPSISDAASFDTSGPMTPLTPATQLPHHFDHSINRIPPLPRPSSSTTSDSIGHNAAVMNFSHPQHAATTTTTTTAHHERASPRLKPQRRTPRHLVDGFYENHHDTPYSITIQYNSKDNDPLALEALPICDDLTGAHGAFAVDTDEHHHHQTTGFRKVLKVIRGH